MKLAKKIGYILATLLFLLFTLGPLVWTFIIAVTPKTALFAPTKNLLPNHITWNNFIELFSGGRKSTAYFTGLINSLKSVLITICIGMPISLLSGYTLSRMEFAGRRLIKNALLITMVIPVMATIIPLYHMFSAGKILDNIFWLCLVYVSSYLPTTTWMISNYLSTIPKELEEAAKIDGCSELRSFIQVILPLSLPIILSVSLIIFLSTWSQFQIPLILASSSNTKPIAIVISEFVTKDTVEYGLIAASGIIALTPPALAAIVFRKYLIAGMMKGSAKG